MGRKKTRGDLVMVARRIDLSIWTRLQSFVDAHTPRVSDTAVIEAAIVEYLERHEKTQRREDRR